jgi:hypothetical protein
MYIFPHVCYFLYKNKLKDNKHLKMEEVYVNMLGALHPNIGSPSPTGDGNVVLLKSKRHAATARRAIADEECAERKLKINKSVRSDLRVRVSDVVFVYACGDAKYASAGVDASARWTKLPGLVRSIWCSSTRFLCGRLSPCFHS